LGRKKRRFVVGYYCERFRRRSIDFSRIESTNVGDVLSTRVAGGVKALVCEERGVIACLAPGDRLRIESPKPGFKKRYGLDHETLVTFDMGEDGCDRFITNKGIIIPLSGFNRRLIITVISVVPRDHDHPAEPACQTQIENESEPVSA
jgi:hypothetical protein